ALVEAAWLELLDVVQTGNRRRHPVVEVRILFEDDRLLGDPLHAGGGVGDLDLLRPVITVSAPDASRVEEIGLDRAGGEEAQEAVALQSVGQGEERVRPGNPQELPLLGRAARGGA